MKGQKIMTNLAKTSRTFAAIIATAALTFAIGSAAQAGDKPARNPAAIDQMTTQSIDIIGTGKAFCTDADAMQSNEAACDAPSAKANTYPVNALSGMNLGTW
jgi:hypothetical protein